MFEQGTSSQTSDRSSSQSSRSASYSHSGSSWGGDVNYSSGFFYGFFGALIGACCWAFISSMMGFQFAWMCLPIGFMTGWAVKTGCKGWNMSCSYMAAWMTFFGCMLGNFMNSCLYYAGQTGSSFFSTFFGMTNNWASGGFFWGPTFHPVDLCFYCFAIFFGYKFSMPSMNGGSKN